MCIFVYIKVYIFFFGKIKVYIYNFIIYIFVCVFVLKFEIISLKISCLFFKKFMKLMLKDYIFLQKLYLIYIWVEYKL